MRISLLRSPTFPDPEADQGEHHFTYSLLPHANGWNETTIAAAYALNNPPLVVGTQENNQSPNPTQSLISTNRPNIIIETIKKAEDGNDLIIRLYESQRHRGPVTLTTNFTIHSAWQTNLLEEKQRQLSPNGNQIKLSFKPYEIVTLRLILKGD